MSTSFESLSENHRPSSTEVFLDTSIHCCLLKGSLFQQRISDVFRRFRWKGASSYAKVEFGNVVLAQAQYYLRKLGELGSLEKVQDYIGNVLPHRLHRAKVTWAFNLLRSFGRDDAECTERATLSLQRLMKLGVAFVEQTCDTPIADGAACYWAKRGVQLTRGQFLWKTPNCQPKCRRCRVDEFFAENEGVFRHIKEAIDALPDGQKSAQLQGFSDVISQALGDPTVLLDYQSGCRRLADAIIAVDSVCYRSFFSQNLAESDLLTEVLGQTLYYLPPDPQKGVLVKSRQMPR
jgi:hypothetical protein